MPISKNDLIYKRKFPFTSHRDIILGSVYDWLFEIHLNVSILSGWSVLFKRSRSLSLYLSLIHTHTYPLRLKVSEAFKMDGKEFDEKKKTNPNGEEKKCHRPTFGLKMKSKRWRLIRMRIVKFIRCGNWETCYEDANESKKTSW